MVMTYSLERDVTMTPGHEVSVGEYNFKFDKVETGIRGLNFIADKGFFTVTKGQKTIAELTPEKKVFLQ